MAVTTAAVVVAVPALAKAPTGSRSNPIAFGKPAKVEDGWVVKVTKTWPVAWPMIHAANEFNDPPKPGTTFFMVRLTATYRGSDQSSNFDEGSFKAVGRSNVSFDTFDPGCSVIPNEISSGDVFRGGTITGNICWQVRKSDASSLEMYFDGFDTKKFFALKR